MTSKEKLENICNYIDLKENNGTLINISFIEFLSNNDKELMAEIKRENRGYIIDTLLDIETELPKKTDLFQHKNYIDPISDNFDTHMITPRLSTMNLSISNLRTYDEIYDYIINFIDSNTNKNKIIERSNIQLNVNLVKDEFDSNIKKILMRLTLCSNIISIEGRLGTPKTVIVGRNNMIYFKEIERLYSDSLKFKFIYDNKIDPNKVIVLRNGSKDDPGIFFCENDYGDFYIKESPRWYKQFCWFWIT